MWELYPRWCWQCSCKPWLWTWGNQSPPGELFPSSPGISGDSVAWSREGTLGNPVVTSRAKVVPCRSWSPAAGWGWCGMVGCAAGLGSGRDPGSCAPLALLYKNLGAAHRPPTTTKRKNPEQWEKTKCYRLLRSISSSSPADRWLQAGRWGGHREQGWLSDGCSLPATFAPVPKTLLVLCSEGSEVTVLTRKGPILLKVCTLSSTPMGTLKWRSFEEVQIFSWTTTLVAVLSHIFGVKEAELSQGSRSSAQSLCDFWVEGTAVVVV